MTMASRQRPTGLSKSPGLGKQLSLTSGCDWNWITPHFLVLTSKPHSLAPLVKMESLRPPGGRWAWDLWPREVVSAQVFQEN